MPISDITSSTNTRKRAVLELIGSRFLRYGLQGPLSGHYKSLKKSVKKRMFLNVFFKTLSDNHLDSRLLLAEAMETAQSPDDLGRVDADDPSGRETVLDDLQRFFVAAATKSWYDHRLVGYIEVGIRGW